MKLYHFGEHLSAFLRSLICLHLTFQLFFPSLLFQLLPEKEIDAVVTVSLNQWTFFAYMLVVGARFFG